MTDQRPNPFRHMGQWYWRDSEGQTHGPFKEQKTALFDLMRSVYPEFDKTTEKAEQLVNWAIIGVFVAGVWLVVWLLK
jgi:hypothetical protein